MSVAEDLVEAFQPWMTPDLQDYLEAIGSMFSEVEEITQGMEGDEEPLWTLLDPDLCPAKCLPYLAQYIGERLPLGIIEPAAREWIKDAPNSRRGTIQSIIRAAQRSLTGLRTVQIRERAGIGGTDNADRIVVVTYEAETPSESAVRIDLDTVVPGDLELVYSVEVGQSWQDVDDTYATWADVAADNDNWQELRAPMPGHTTYTRPRPW